MALNVTVDLKTPHKPWQKNDAAKIVTRYLEMCGFGSQEAEEWKIRLGDQVHGAGRTPELRLIPITPGTGGHVGIQIVLKLNGNGSVYKALLLLPHKKPEVVIQRFTVLREWEDRGWKPLVESKLELEQPVPLHGAARVEDPDLVEELVEALDSLLGVSSSAEELPPEKTIQKKSAVPSKIGAFTHDDQKPEILLLVLRERGLVNRQISLEEIRSIFRELEGQSVSNRSIGRVLGGLGRNAILRVHRDSLKRITGISLLEEAPTSAELSSLEPKPDTKLNNQETSSVVPITAEKALQVEIDAILPELEYRRERREDLQRQIAELQNQANSLDQDMESLERRYLRLTRSLQVLRGEL